MPPPSADFNKFIENCVARSVGIFVKKNITQIIFQTAVLVISVTPEPTGLWIRGDHGLYFVVQNPSGHYPTVF